MTLTGQDGEDDIAGGETGLQSLGTSSLDGSQPMAGHRPQDLDELTVAIGVLGELGTDLGQARMASPRYLR